MGRPEDGGVEELTYSPLLTKSQKEEARKLCGEFAEQFAARPGHSAIATHSIFTGDEQLVAERAHRVPQSQKQAIKNELRDAGSRYYQAF